MSDLKQIEKAIFDTALELDGAQLRAAFLDQACNGNPVLRSRLEKLLALAPSAEEFFRSSPMHLKAADLRAPGAGSAHSSKPGSNPPETVNAVIGRYRLLQRLGEGGCGVVYLAEQEEPVRRRVALKIIRLGMDTESVIARFQAERQALAMLDHPNIAHVLDAGATESGRPYFVMELVSGARITDYCDQNNLDTRQRLDLFIQVCHAIQHAHQKGVIHRDIKPSNILVSLHDGAPAPKVIDFGIAKATQGRLMDNTLFTASDQFMGTPAYMSPEQADLNRMDVDTRSDIYALGVLLYEMLTGQTPFDSKELVKGGMDEMRRTLREQEPQRPSTLLTTLGKTKLHIVALQHHAEPPRLISTVRGDLDWIVMKAMEKDRSRRYETAKDLAVDVQRFLDNEPILARPPSRLYRLQKLVRRNKIVFMAGAIVGLALIIGFGMVTWSWHQEREARKRAVAAEQQQIRLREESDHLRQQAEFRQKLTEANVARIRGNIEDADRLVAGIPVLEAKLEYADLYRVLGDWNAENGRWKQAMHKIVPLVQIYQPDDWDATTMDDLRYSSLLLELGDNAGYEQFRQLTVAHFVDSTNSVAAERVIKMSTFTPASAELLAAMAPLAATASNSLNNASVLDDWHRGLARWRAFSLALMEYRRGNYVGVEEWHKKALTYVARDSARDADFQVLLAMTHYQTGDIEQARAELASARRKIAMYFNYVPMPRGDGYWYDWLFARILLREATGLANSKG